MSKQPIFVTILKHVLKRSKQKKFRFLKYNQTGFQNNNQGNPLNNSRQFNNPQPPKQNNNAGRGNYNPPDSNQGNTPQPHRTLSRNNIRWQRSSTSLNRRRSNTKTANQPKLWSSLLKEQRAPHINYNVSPQQQPVHQHNNKDYLLTCVLQSHQELVKYSQSSSAITPSLTLQSTIMADLQGLEPWCCE